MSFKIKEVATCMNKPQRHYATWKKLDTKKKMYDSIYMKCSENRLMVDWDKEWGQGVTVNGYEQSLQW